MMGINIGVDKEKDANEHYYGDRDWNRLNHLLAKDFPRES